MKSRIGLCLVLVAYLPVLVAAEDVVRESVVKLHVTARAPNFMEPWTKANAKSQSGSGAIIAGNRILTNAHVVLYANQIFIQFHESTDRHPAVVAAISPEMDLAVVEMEDPSLLQGRPPLEIQTGIPGFKETVNVYGYPMGGNDLSITEGIISRIEYANFSSDGAGLRIQVDAALNPGNSGGPAVVDGKIIGLVFSKISQADGIGYLIPSVEIQMFLDDIADRTYDGKPNVFDLRQSTENPALREKLGLTDDVTGVMVKTPDDESDEYPIKAWDVITHIGTHDIDNRGHVELRDDLRVLFPFLIPELTADEHVPMTIFREGQEIEVQVPVVRKRPLILPELNGEYPRHFIYGPMVFTPATRDLVRNLGSKGLTLFAAMDSPLLYSYNAKPDFPDEELVVFRMLDHRRTKGYGSIPFGVITHVNDISVKNLRHLMELLRDNQQEFITYTVGGLYETIVFRRDEMQETTEDVMDESGIRYQYSKDLAEVWEKGPQSVSTEEVGTAGG